MNETLKTLLTRRSIRAYKPEQLKEEELQAILEAGRYAPSGMNRQAWHFSVIQNQELLGKLGGIIREAMLRSGIPQMVDRAKAENFNAFYGAPTLIVVSGDEQAPTTPFDCALAMGNMFNAAASLGIGSCWIHAVSQIVGNGSEPSLIKAMGIPDGYKIYSSGVFGYGAGEVPAPAQRREGTVGFVK